MVLLGGVHPAGQLLLHRRSPELPSAPSNAPSEVMVLLGGVHPAGEPLLQGAYHADSAAVRWFATRKEEVGSQATWEGNDDVELAGGASSQTGATRQPWGVAARLETW